MPATYEPIATTTLGSASATITFSSIPSTYTDLILVAALIPADAGYPYMRINSDSGTNYSNTRIIGNGTAASSSRATSNTEGFVATGYNANNYTKPVLHTLHFFNYAGSTFKTHLAEASMDGNGAGDVQRGVGLWRSTSAITSISLLKAAGTWSTGSTATLYGILRA